MNAKTLGLLFILSIGQIALAQNEVKKKSIKLSSSKPKETDPNKKPIYIPNVIYAVTADVGQVPIGNYMVGAEIAPLDWLAIELGIGVTHRNYARDFLFDEDKSIDGVSPTFGLGPAFNGFAKVFYDDYAMETAGYFALMYAYHSFKRSYRFNNTTYSETDNYQEIGCGYGWMYFMEDRIFFDLFAGVKLSTAEGILLNSYYNSNNSSMEYSVQNYDRNIVGFSYFFSLKLGYVLN